MEEDYQLHPQAGVPRARGSRPVLLAAVLAFLAGAAIVALLAWHGDLARVLPAPGGSVATGQAPAAGTGGKEQEQVSGLETRLALLEDRFSRLNLQASAASGNAARAEGLLIAFAARRQVDRGQPFGYLADQLRLRFADAQPQAVATLIAFAQDPVTLDALDARLDALAPQLNDTPVAPSIWGRMKGELGHLFVVRSDSAPPISAGARIDRIKLMIAAGKVDDAAADLARTPGSAAAAGLIADTRRYGAAQQALDLIETTAMIEPHRLQDADGNRVEQPSPLGAPTGAAGP